MDTKAPNPARCLDIKNRGIDATAAYGKDVWWSGNCKARVRGNLLRDAQARGSDIQAAMQNILDTCDHGFQYIGAVRVEIYLCMVGTVRVECNSLPQHEIASAERDDEGVGIASMGAGMTSTRSTDFRPVTTSQTSLRRLLTL